MTISFAYIEQAWGEDVKRDNRTKRDPTTKARKSRSYNKVYDDIIDTYIESDGKQSVASYEPSKQNYLGQNTNEEGVYKRKDENHTYRPKPQPCDTVMTGFHESKLSNSSMDYNNYGFEDNMFTKRGINNTISQTASYEQPTNHLDEEEQPYIFPPAEEEQYYTHSPSTLINPQPSFQEEKYSLPQGSDNYHEKHIEHDEPVVDTFTKYHGLIELALFVFAGILMIFMLEQFVQLGVYLR